jgi:hypothetical protein
MPSSVKLRSQIQFKLSCIPLKHSDYYIVTCLQVILTPTCRVSGYPRQVIKVALLRRLRFIWTALPTVITHITIIPLGTYNSSSWYIFLRDDATSLVHLSSLMTAVCLRLPFTTRDWLLFWLSYWLLLLTLLLTYWLLAATFTDRSLHSIA